MYPQVTFVHFGALVERPRIVGRTASSVANQTEAATTVNAEHRKRDGYANQETFGSCIYIVKEVWKN